MTDFKTLLDEKNARALDRRGVELLAQTEIKRWFPDIHEEQRAECVAYLNTKTSVLNDSVSARSFVENPRVNGEALSGLWRMVYAGTEEGRSGIVQVLRKGFITTLGTGGAVDWSEFYIVNEQGFHSSHEMPVLRLNNVAPEAAHDLVAYLNQDTFTDIAYRDDTLSGTWNRIKVRSDVQEDGSYTIDLFLTDTLNETLYFTFMETAGVRKGFLYRREATQASVDEVTDATWFDSDGNKYTEAGTDCYRIGGQDTLPAGWTVVNKSTRRDDGGDLLWDMDVEITWSTSQELYSRIYSGKNTIKGNYYKWGITEDEFDELFLHSLFDNSTGENIGPPELIGVSGINIGDISNKDIGYLEHDDNGRAIFKSADETIAVFHSDYTGTGKWYFFETVTSQFLYEAESDASLPPNTGWVTIGGTGTLTWVGLHFSYPTDVSALWEATTGRTVGVRKLARAGSDGLFDAEIEIVWVTGSSKSVTTAGQILFTGTNITPDSSTEVCMKADGSLVTWSAFKTYLSALRVSPRVQLNPDGTLNYEAVARVEGDALTLRYSPNDHLLIDRTFGYGLDEEDIQNVLENTSVVPPTSFITGS
jgi:hypothetical protein